VYREPAHSFVHELRDLGIQSEQLRAELAVAERLARPRRVLGVVRVVALVAAAAVGVASAGLIRGRRHEEVSSRRVTEACWTAVDAMAARRRSALESHEKCMLQNRRILRESSRSVWARNARDSGRLPPDPGVAEMVAFCRSQAQAAERECSSQ
jgi:hypothetical protein